MRIKAPGGEGPQHLHVGNKKLHLLLSMLSKWIMQLMRSMNSLKTTTDDVVTDTESFLGESHDTSVLMDYVHHVAMTVWNGKVFIFLNK